MKTHWKSALLMGLALSATACGTQNRGLDSVHQPVVRQTSYVFDVPVSGGLALADQQRLGAWLGALQPSYGDEITIDTSSADTVGDAPRIVADLVGRYGLKLSPIAPVTAGEIGAGQIRVIVSRMTADVPGCPDWSRPSDPNFSGHTMSNYGCATNSNLAAMIADPADLLSGRTGNPLDGTMPTSKALKIYREATPTGADGLKEEANGQ